MLGISAIIGSTVCIVTMIPLQFLIGKKMSSNAKLTAVSIHCPYIFLFALDFESFFPHFSHFSCTYGENDRHRLSFPSKCHTSDCVCFSPLLWPH